MADGTMFQAKLRRMQNSQPWGFRMKGGAQQGMPLFVEHVAPNSRGAHAGLSPGDIIVQICGNNVQGVSHDQAKGEILRAGNELDFWVLKGGMKQAGGGGGGGGGGAVSHAAPMAAAPPAAEPPRAIVVEEPTARMGGPIFKQVKPKTYQVLESELPASEQGQAPRPASIFDRKRQDRSDYLKATGPTIQKAYGQTH